MHLDFLKFLGKLVVKYVSTYTTGTLKKVSERLIKCCLCHVFVFSFSDFFIKECVVGTHLNGINKLMQLTCNSDVYPQHMPL